MADERSFFLIRRTKVAGLPSCRMWRYFLCDFSIELTTDQTTLNERSG